MRKWAVLQESPRAGGEIPNPFFGNLLQQDLCNAIFVYLWTKSSNLTIKSGTGLSPRQTIWNETLQISPHIIPGSALLRSHLHQPGLSFGLGFSPREALQLRPAGCQGGRQITNALKWVRRPASLANLGHTNAAESHVWKSKLRQERY